MPEVRKDIDAVMAAQADLVEIVHTLRQVVRVKGYHASSVSNPCIGDQPCIASS